MYIFDSVSDCIDGLRGYDEGSIYSLDVVGGCSCEFECFGSILVVLSGGREVFGSSSVIIKIWWLYIPWYLIIG